MGAALTYARRYALFTLAGIAGEDDIDAPNLPLGVKDSGASGRSHAERMNGGSADRNTSPRRAKRSRPADRKRQGLTSVLSVNASKSIRDKLVEEIAVLDSAEGALAWAIRRIRLKNYLTAEDAAIVEKAFRDRIGVLAPEAYPENLPSKSMASCKVGHNCNRPVLLWNRLLLTPRLTSLRNRASAMREANPSTTQASQAY
jgi:hypothetical protein